MTRYDPTLLILIAMFCSSPVLAQRGHDHSGDVHAGGGNGRHGNSAYGKAKVEERDRLLSKLKNTNICRGC